SSRRRHTRSYGDWSSDVCSSDLHFLKPEEHLHHRVVNAIRTGGLLTTVAPPEITTGEAWFKPGAEMQKCFLDHPEWLEATQEIADRCNLSLELKKLILPECSVPDGESAFSHLWKLSFDGARKRYKPLRPKVLSRLAHELDRKSTRLNSSHRTISYAVFCLKKKNKVYQSQT